MSEERFRVLAGVIAAHPDRKVVGRTRLQKEIMLLQRLGLPTDYDYMIYFYGPYSEGLQAEIGLIEQWGLIKEREEISSGTMQPYYILTAHESARLEDVEARFGDAIRLMNDTDATVLELAATYDAFRSDFEMNDAQALEALRRKKGNKCNNGNEQKALDLLRDLKLMQESE